jgi:hypothetical protein
MTRSAIALGGLLAIAGCTARRAPLQGTPDSGSPTADAGPEAADSGIVDSGIPDSGQPIDGGNVVDAGPDAGVDAGAMSDSGAVPSCWTDGSTCFGTPTVVHGNDVFTMTLGTTDFNNDGFDDLIQAGYGLDEANPTTAINLFYGASDGGMWLGPTFTESLYATATNADLNGDGWMDFIAASGKAIDIELNQADGSFNSTVINVNTYPNPLVYAVRAADFDGDGRPDIAACTSAGLFIYFDDSGAPSYGDPVQVPPAGSGDNGESCISLAVGDLDGDGTADIVSVDSLPSYGLYVRLNSADAGFSLTTLSTSCTETAAGQLVVADLNGDGLPDVVCGTAAGIEVRLNQGGGTLGPPIDVGTNPETSWYVEQVLVADLNGDGFPDVFGAGSEGTCDPDAGPLWAGAYYFLNDGDGGFAVGQALPTGQASVHGISALHLPGTILPSLAIGDWCTPDITIFPNGPVDAGT